MIGNDRGQSLITKYVWVIDTIYKARKITFKELNRRWLNDDISRGLAIPKRTFDNWRHVIWDMFGIDIVNENRGEYRYYIDNEEDISKNGLRSWLYSTISVSHTLANSQSIKLFRQRWYLVARSTYAYYYEKGPRIYALDRIIDIQTTDETFEMPKDWRSKEFFDDCFGIIADQRIEPQTVKLKVAVGQANYIRDLELHESQEEVERNDEYSIFEYFLRPSYDFLQEILWNGEEMEVLEPQWFREEIAGKIQRMWNKYSASGDKNELV